jgi:hypothetical protein
MVWEAGIIHIVEEIKLLLLLGNRLVIVGQTYPRKHIRGNYKNGCVYVFQNNSGTPSSDFSQTWYTYDYKIWINKYPGNAG